MGINFLICSFPNSPKPISPTLYSQIRFLDIFSPNLRHRIWIWSGDFAVGAGFKKQGDFEIAVVEEDSTRISGVGEDDSDEMATTTTRRCRVGLLPDFNQPPPTVFEFSASVLPNRVKKPEFLSKAFIPWRTLKEIGIGLMVFQQFGGINGVGFYVSETFVETECIEWIQWYSYGLRSNRHWKNTHGWESG